MDGNVHTMPTDGKHVESKECFCHPVLDYKDLLTGIEHWVHNDTRQEALH